VRKRKQEKAVKSTCTLFCGESASLIRKRKKRREKGKIKEIK